MVAAGTINSDPNQLKVIGKLDRLPGGVNAGVCVSGSFSVSVSGGVSGG